jgi:tetratricopeptide (TPR) repeat protein
MKVFDKYGLLCFCFILLVPLTVSAQKEVRALIREGNKLYKKKHYTEAEVAYKKALEKDPKSSIGLYNLGNDLYRQENWSEALEKYQLAGSLAKKPHQKAAIFHNMGNSYMAIKDYGKAVDAYKQSLRLNPQDDETRYNLAVAQAFLKQQQQKQKNNEDKKDQNNKDNKDNKQQPNQSKSQDDQKKGNKEQQPSSAQEQITKEKAQQLLDALMQDEKETQEKVKRLQMQQSQSRKTDKDW